MTDKERIAELEEALARANELLSQQQAMYERQLEEAYALADTHARAIADSIEALVTR